MAQSLSAEKQKVYKEKFAKFDKNGDGTISKDELGAALKSLNRSPTPSTLQKVMEGIDTDKSGVIEYEEFVQMMIQLDAEIEKGLKATFDQFDKDKSGTLCVQELGAVFEDLGVEVTDEELKQEIKGFDVNEDGQLNFEEFKKLFGRV